MGIQMTSDGTGIYYKQLRSLSNSSQIIFDMGLHFDNSQLRLNNYSYDRNYQSIMLDLTAGYRNELFPDKLAGSFRPLLFFGSGGILDLYSLTKDNIAGTWMIKYMLGIGLNFYNRNILNEISLKYIHSKAIKGHAAFQISFYWK